jgi:DNA-binding IclR family transcriptional regulator
VSDQTPNPGGLASVDRSLRLLEELARSGDLGVTELAHRIGAAKATAHRLAKTLEARGYVVRNSNATYRLGPRCLYLARGAEASVDLRTAALPALLDLRDATGETAQLTVYDDGDAVYVEQIVSPKAVRSVGEVGSRVPAPCVSGGLVLLAFGPPERAESVTMRPAAAPTEEAARRLGDLVTELETVRTRGYAVNRGGFNPDVGGVGAPVYDAGGAIVASVSACVPLFRIDEVGVDMLAEHVVAAAASITRDLGGDPAGEPVAEPATV